MESHTIHISKLADMLKATGPKILHVLGDVERDKEGEPVWPRGWKGEVKAITQEGMTVEFTRASGRE